jgi:hypothetical protein
MAPLLRLTAKGIVAERLERVQTMRSIPEAH